MAQLPQFVKDFTAYLDGAGLAGMIDEATLPSISLETEDHSAGGMGGTVDIWMGLIEKLEVYLTMTGLSSSFTDQLGNPDTAITNRGVISDGQTTSSAIFQMRGLFKKVEFGALKRKDKGSTKITATLTYYKVTIADKVIIEIDILNKVFVRNGVDLFTEHRKALGG